MVKWRPSRQATFTPVTVLASSLVSSSTALAFMMSRMFWLCLIRPPMPSVSAACEPVMYSLVSRVLSLKSSSLRSSETHGAISSESMPVSHSLSARR